MPRLRSSFCLAGSCKAAAATAAVAGAVLWAVCLVRGADGDPSTGDGRGPAFTVENPRVVVLKSRGWLHLFDGDALVRSYPIALGHNPVGPKRLLADGRTPEGAFRICERRLASEHHRFLGIDYPGAEAARWGLAAGLLTDGEARAIQEASAEGRCPPWDTALGGAIGIHGHGSKADHADRNWTAGCVALADAHVEELFDVLRLGDVVEILP